jgi:hypothetical protein
MDLLTPVMTHFEKKNISHYLAMNQLIGKLPIDFSARRRIFLYTLFFEILIFLV